MNDIRLKIRLFYIAKGSAAELLTQLHIVSEVYDINEVEINSSIGDTDEISKRMRGLISSCSK